MPLITRLLLAGFFALVSTPAWAQHWGTVWAGAAQGPFPVGYPSAEPSLDAAFPQPANGSHDQSFRLIIKPDLFGRQMRFRFSNMFGTRPVTFDTAFAGLQMSGAAVVPGTNRPITFAGKTSTTVPPGTEIWSDAVTLPFVHDPAAIDLAGRRLAVTFHVPGDSGPMTWHALALTTSYVTAPSAGAIGNLEDDSAFPYSATSWFFLDAADAMVAPETRIVVCLGDDDTDGTNSTLNGDDRWTDVLSRRLRAEGQRVAVVNEAIAGNQILVPAEYGPGNPVPGGPSVSSRLASDVLALSGVTDVILAEGINDLAKGGASPDAVADAMRALADRIRGRFKGVKLVGATVVSSRGSSVPGYGTVDVDNRRHQLNDLIRKPGLFDSVIDFDMATVDTQTGELRADEVPSSTIGGPGDKLHPNRAGYLAMGGAVDLRSVSPPPRSRQPPRPRPVASPDSTSAATQ